MLTESSPSVGWTNLILKKPNPNKPNLINITVATILNYPKLTILIKCHCLALRLQIDISLLSIGLTTLNQRTRQANRFLTPITPSESAGLRPLEKVLNRVLPRFLVDWPIDFDLMTFGQITIGQSTVGQLTFDQMTRAPRKRPKTETHRG